MRVRREGLHGSGEERAGFFGGSEGVEEEGGVVEPDGGGLGEFFGGGLEEGVGFLGGRLAFMWGLLVCFRDGYGLPDSCRIECRC